MKEKYTSNFIQPEKPGWHSGGKLPVIENTDEGKIVSVENSQYSLADAQKILPEYDGTVEYSTDAK